MLNHQVSPLNQLPSNLCSKDSIDLSRKYGGYFIKAQIIPYKPLPELYFSLLLNRQEPQKEDLLLSLYQHMNLLCCAQVFETFLYSQLRSLMEEAIYLYKLSGQSIELGIHRFPRCSYTLNKHVSNSRFICSLLQMPRRPNQSILKEISPECSLEGLMLKLKLQSFGHLMRRTDSFEKTLMLAKIEWERTRGRQRMRWLDGITG